MNNLPELNDASSEAAEVLRVDIGALYEQLKVATERLALERELAAGVHRAASRVVAESPALQLIFGSADIDALAGEQPGSESPESADKILSSVFHGAGTSAELPEGFAATTSGICTQQTIQTSVAAAMRLLRKSRTASPG